MNVWDSVLVNEAVHNYKRYLDTKEEEKYKDMLCNGLSSDSAFERAFTAGVIEWLASRHFDITARIDSTACTLAEPAFPKMYEHPTADVSVLERALPEFRKYNVMIHYFG